MPPLFSPRRGHPVDFRQHLEVETPEHVVLDLEIAGIGSRALAALLDTLVLAVALLILGVLLALLGRYVALGLLGGAIAGLAALVSMFGYFVLFEAFGRGQTPGKRWLGIRVVGDTGHPVTVGAAALRNLLRVADALPPPYLTGIVLVALHPRAKRLGDLVAGTIVVRDRPSESAAAGQAVTAATADAPLAAPELSDEEYRLLGQYLERAPSLAPAVRERLAAGLVARLAARVTLRPGATADVLAGLHAEESARRSGALGGRVGAGAGERFAARQQERWGTFQSLAERATRDGLDSFRPEELPDFAGRYREVAADLARARTYRAGAGTLARLERLVAAGHNLLYEDERATGRRLLAFVTRECPAAVVQARGYVLVAFLMFMVPAVAGYSLLREQPALAAELLPDVMLRRAEAGAERIAEGKRYVTTEAVERPGLASFLITNNVRVAFFCFAGGIFLGVGSLVLLAFNGFAIGTAAGHFANSGVLGYLLEFIVGHGVLELFAIWVAGAAGFLLGRSIIAPGDLTRADALVLSGRLAIRMVGAAVVLLVVAGLIEGFVSAGDYGMGARLATSAASLVVLAIYLAWGAVTLRGESCASGSPAPRSPAIR